MKTNQTDASQAGVQARLDAWESALNAYREQANETNAGDRRKLQQAVEPMDAERSKVLHKLKVLRDSGSDSPDELQNALDNIADEIDQTMQSIASRFR